MNGQWANADSGETYDVYNPADGSVLGEVPKMGKVETTRAIDAAVAAFPFWSSKTAINSGLK